jgi:predicted membrane protein
MNYDKIKTILTGFIFFSLFIIIFLINISLTAVCFTFNKLYDFVEKTTKGSKEPEVVS